MSGKKGMIQDHSGRPKNREPYKKCLKLTLKQRKLVNEYFKNGGNKTAAMRSAGLGGSKLYQHTNTWTAFNQPAVKLEMENPTGATQSPIIEALSSKSKGDSMEILAKYAGLEYNKKYNMLLRGNKQVTLSEVLRFYGVLGTTIRCPHCLAPLGLDLFFLHMQNNFQNKGHNLTHRQFIRFFLDEESGKNSQIIWDKNNSHR